MLVTLLLAGCASTQTQQPVSAAGSAVGGIATGTPAASTTVLGGGMTGSVIQSVTGEPGMCYYRLTDGSLGKDPCPPGYAGP